MSTSQGRNIAGKIIFDREHEESIQAKENDNEPLLAGFKSNLQGNDSPKLAVTAP